MGVDGWGVLTRTHGLRVIRSRWTKPRKENSESQKRANQIVWTQFWSEKKVNRDKRCFFSLASLILIVITVHFS